MEEPVCKFCHCPAEFPIESRDGEEDEETMGPLFSPCNCKGSLKYVHVLCLSRWRQVSPNPRSATHCDTCEQTYKLSYLFNVANRPHATAIFTTLTMGTVVAGIGSGVLMLRGSEWSLLMALWNGFVFVGLVGSIGQPYEFFLRSLKNKENLELKSQHVLGLGFLIYGFSTAYSRLYSFLHQKSKVWIASVAVL